MVSKPFSNGCLSGIRHKSQRLPAQVNLARPLKQHKAPKEPGRLVWTPYDANSFLP